MQIDKLKWDGCYLGKYENNIILAKEKHKNCYFFIIRLEIDNEKYIIPCRYIKTKDKFANIVDELKPIFGLKKIGSHSLIISNKLYIIYKNDYKITNDQYYIYSYKSLSKFSRKDPIRTKLANNIKKIIIFRELLAIKYYYIETSILIDDKNMSIYSINENESNANYESSSRSIITNKIAIDWFLDNDIALYVKYITNNFKSNSSECEDVNITIIRLKHQIEDTIERIDKQFLWYSSYIINRCLNYLNK